MMINPILFYLINVCNTLRVMSIMLAVGCGFGSLLSLLISRDLYGEDEKEALKLSKIFIILAVVFTILSVLFPDKETSYQMLVASQVTTDNVNNAIESIKNCVDYIVEVMNKWLI